MKSILIFITMLYSLSAASETVCESPEGKGGWKVPESAFTKKAAEESLEKLKRYTSNGTDGMDSTSFFNEFTIIRGYLLKSRTTTDMSGTKKEFCEFLKKDAYIRH